MLSRNNIWLTVLSNNVSMLHCIAQENDIRTHDSKSSRYDIVIALLNQ